MDRDDGFGSQGKEEVVHTKKQLLDEKQVWLQWKRVGKNTKRQRRVVQASSEEMIWK